MSERRPGNLTPAGPSEPVAHGLSREGAGDYGGARLPPEEPESSGLDLKKLPSVFLRYKWLVLASVLVGLVVGFFAMRLTPPRYTVSALIQVQNPLSAETGVTAIQAGQTRHPEDWQNLLLSFSVLEPVVHDLRRFISRPGEDPHEIFDASEVVGDVVPGTYVLERPVQGGTPRILGGDGGVVDQPSDPEELGVRLGVRLNLPSELLEPGQRVEFTLTRPRDAARELASSLGVQIGRTAYMSVMLSASSPTRAAELLNAIAESFIREATELTRARSNELSQVLEEQFATAKVSLEEAEEALEAFQSSNILRPSGFPGDAGDAGDGAMDRYVDVQLELQELQRDRAAIQRALEERGATGGIRLQALETIPTARSSSELSRVLESVADLRAERRALLLRYTEDHPQVVVLSDQLTRLEAEVVPSVATELIEELDVRISSLDARASAQAAEIGSIPARTMTEAGLQREVERATILYEDVSARYASARLASISASPDVRVVDWAAPPTNPDSDRRLLMGSLTFLAFAGAGLVGAILLDRADRRVRSPGDVEWQLGLPVMGVLPHLRNRRGLVNPHDQGQAVEAFRSIRTGILYAHGSAGPLVLTVSSPGAADGKSFTVSNLALSFAKLGRSTVIVDGDVRRGVQHKLLNVDRKPGLTDFLADRASLGEVVKQTDHPLLSVVPLGSMLTQAPEMLSTPPMQDLLAALKGEFDVILVDTCPLGAAADPVILGTLTGNLALVVRSGTTDVEHAEAMLQNLRRFPVRVLGAIVNDVSPTDDYSYYGYVPGYTVEETEELEPRRELHLTGAGKR